MGKVAPLSTHFGNVSALKSSPQKPSSNGLRKLSGPMKCKKSNEAVAQKDGTTTIYIKPRKGRTLECRIDTADYETVRPYSWSALVKPRTTYAKTVVEKNGKKTTLLMHSLILPDAKVVDHRDSDGLNNRRNNLRTATHRQNSGNVRKIRRKTSSAFRGVHLHRCGKFQAQIRDGGKVINLGLFASEVDAANAYNRSAQRIFGDFAKLNEFSNSFKKSEPASLPLPVSQLSLF